VASQVPRDLAAGRSITRANQLLLRELPQQFVDLAGELVQLNVELQRQSFFPSSA
jgi:hypothetical protein